MNVKPLVKYFPELDGMDSEQQEALLRCAHERCFGPDKKLAVWRNNLLGGLLLTGISLLIIVVIGPLLQVPAGASAALVMLVVLPAFFFWQQRNHIRNLRPALMECLAENAARP